MFVIAEIYLDLRAWQTSLDQKPSETGFHRRFGRRRHRSEALQLSAPERFRRRQLLTQCRVHGDKNFHRRQAQGKMVDGARQRGSPQSLHCDHLARQDPAASHAQSRPRAQA
jgi:hypothetical protein